MLHQKLKDDLKEAMKARDTLRMTVLRSLITACTNESVAKKRKPDEMLSDEETLAVISRASKQRRDSIEQFRRGGRNDLAEQEEKELALVEAYLPELMGEADVRAFVEKKKTELGVTDAAQKGLLMKEIMKELKGKADGAVVKTAVDALF